MAKDCRGNKCGTVKNDLDEEGRAAEKQRAQRQADRGAQLLTGDARKAASEMRRRQRMLQDL